MVPLTAGWPRHVGKGRVMRSAYKVLASLLAVLIMVQAAAMVWAIAGLYGFVEDGNSFDKSLMEPGAEAPFTEVLGFAIHGMNGTMLIPLVVLALLGVSFKAGIPKGTAVAGVLLLLVALQVALGILGHSLPFAGLLHGVNALILFAGTLHAARLAGRTAETTAAPGQPARV